MTGVSYKITLQDKEARDVLDRLVARIGNLTGFYKSVGEHLLNSTMDNFQRETGPDGLPWERLMPRTIEQREKRGYVPIHILRASGRLAGSINLVSTSQEARIGTPVVYAAAHQLGAKIEKKERQQTIYQHYDAKTDTLDQKFRKKSKSNFARDVTVKAHVINIPARPFIGVSKEDETIIVGIADEWLRDEN